MSIFITKTKIVKAIIIVTMHLKSFIIYTLLFIVSASFKIYSYSKVRN